MPTALAPAEHTPGPRFDNQRANLPAIEPASAAAPTLTANTPGSARADGLGTTKTPIDEATTAVAIAAT